MDLIEVEGKDKNVSKVKHLDSFLIISDNIETGGRTKFLSGYLGS